MFGKQSARFRANGFGLKGQGQGGNDVSKIGPGVRIVGEILGEGEVRLDGQLRGTIRVEGTLRIGPGARLEGEVDAAEVILLGSAQGKIRARKRLAIHSSGLLEGSFVTPRLLIEEGGRFQGRCRMTDAKSEPKHGDTGTPPPAAQPKTK